MPETIPTEPTILDQIIMFLMSPLGLVVVGFIVACLLVFFFFRIKKDKWFEPVPLETILRNQFNNIIKFTELRGNWATLRREDKIIGKILRVGKFFITLKEDKEYIEKEFYLFKISLNPNIPIIRSIMDLFNPPKKVIVDTLNIKRFDFETVNIKKVKTFFNIKQEATPFSFANIIIYGIQSYEVIKQLSWWYGREQELEVLVNYPKRVVYIEMAMAKKIETFNELDKIEREKYKDKVGHLTGT